MENQPVKSSGVVVASSEAVHNHYRIVRFRNRPMIEHPLPFPHYRVLHKEHFDAIAYPILGGVSRSRMQDVYAYLASTAEDLSFNSHLIGFGITDMSAVVEADTPIEHYAANRPKVWNMRTLQFDTTYDISDTVWRSPYPPLSVIKDAPASNSEPIPFIMSLAGNDSGLYDDIMQSIAPLFMERKPDGVIWWVGSGANGKSTLMDALYRLFPYQLASINVKRLVDGRDTPSLNGRLANIVKESSEGRVDDTDLYKSLGTHESFRVHKFHSQEDVEIYGNIHTIFSANQIPAFNDKGYSARRRTFIVPFLQTFESDPAFEQKTFTPAFFSRFISEIARYAQRLRDQHYRYKWSAATTASKLEYDAEASNAEEYVRQAVNEGIVAFNGFNVFRMDYERWCADEGYVPLGVGNLRRAAKVFGFERSTMRPGQTDKAKTENVYRLRTVRLQTDLVPLPLSLNRPGLFTLPGFHKDVSSKPEVPEWKPESILKGKW